jgi:hypothetical protein
MIVHSSAAWVVHIMVKTLEKLFHTFFFGNYFYGICAVALSIEASLQQGYSLNHPFWYILLFVGTVIYYTIAYLHEKNSTSINPRTIWYKEHQAWIRKSQWLLLLIAVITGSYLVFQYGSGIQFVKTWQWIIILVFPTLAVWYYGDAIPWLHKISLRSKGWIKPFVIGFIWAGVVNIYPAILSVIENKSSYEPDVFHFLLFLKNGMFISMLCILFDIKDYATDYNEELKTFVVRFGLRKTLFYIIIPLTAIGLGTFLTYGTVHHFPLFRMLINTVSFILLIIVTYHMHRRKSILYYLAIIDGLMLVKAICGIGGSWIQHT